jgi:predicted amidohydrolase YtcJ
VLLHLEEVAVVDDERAVFEGRAAGPITPQLEYASYGITTFGDVNVRGLTAMQSYFDAARNHQMLIRGYIMNTIEYFGEVDGRRDEVDAMRYEDDYLTFGGYKFLLDGAVAAMFAGGIATAVLALRRI